MMRQKLSSKKIKGVSLLEVMLSLAILSVAMLAMIKLQRNLMVANDLATQRVQAVTLAKNKIESFRHYGSLTTGTGTLAYEDISTGSDSVTGKNVTYQRSWLVTDNATLKYKTITVTVTWTDQTGASQTVQLSSIIAHHDVSGSGELFL